MASGHRNWEYIRGPLDFVVGRGREGGTAIPSETLKKARLPIHDGKNGNRARSLVSKACTPVVLHYEIL